MVKYDYIPNDFGKTWVASRHEARRGIHTPLAFVDINEGNRTDADLFSQIMYWHEPNLETGKPRLTRQREGLYWITKNHSDWWRETRIKMETIRKSLKRLQDRGLIVYDIHGERGVECPWIRVNWDEFERRMRLWMDNDMSNLSEKDCEILIKKLFHTTGKKSQGAGKKSQPPLVTDTTPLVTDTSSNTETPSETPEITEKEKSTADAGADAPAIFEVFVDGMDMDGVGDESSEATPSVEELLLGKTALQAAIAFTWDTNAQVWGGWNGRIRAFLTGQVSAKMKGTDWDTFKIEEPMTPVEVVAFGFWYQDEEPEKDVVPKGLEVLNRRIDEFRVALNYDRALEVAREKLIRLMGIEESPRDESDRITAADEQEIDDALQAALAAMGGIQS